MKGLLYKDLLSLRQFRAMALIIVAGVLSSFYSGQVDMVATLCIILTATIPISLLGLEEKARWNTVALTLPVSRPVLAGEKYLFGLGTLLTGTGLAIGLGMAVIPGAGYETVTLCAALFCFGIIIQSVMLPLVFRFGMEKGQLFTMGLLFLLAAGLVVLVGNGWLALSGTLLWVLPIAAAIVWGLSLFLSVRLIKGLDL
ncbi:MAG: ABC-2 transporter permease [Acutalibacteraceae bacterium]|nr:ABC-2 transporter permease [Bacillota bacterium]